MEIAKLVLEYFKAFLTAPVLFSVVAVIFIGKFSEDIKTLLLRVATIKLPGGAEVSTHQSSRIAEEEKSAPQYTDRPIQGLPAGLTAEQIKATEQLVRSHIASTYLWEYRYLNYFLVRGTQVVFDWFVGLPQPIIYEHYDSYWLPAVPSVNERVAIISALKNHRLVVEDDANMISVTPKGREYHEWRGELPPQANV